MPAVTQPILTVLHQHADRVGCLKDHELNSSALHLLIELLLFYRSIQVPQRLKRRMTQMAAMRSGGRPAVSTTLWVPSCDSSVSIYSANSRLVSLVVSFAHSAGQNSAIKTKAQLLLFWFISLFLIVNVFCDLVFLLHFLFLHFLFVFLQSHADQSGNWPWVSPSDGGLGDPRFRYCLTSLNMPRRCIGLARRRVGRGGRWV